MGKYTKWITGGLGFVTFGPIGAVIGFLLGSLIDSEVDITHQQSVSTDGHTTQEGDFKMSLLVLMACVMNADGRVKKTELKIVKKFLLQNFGEEAAKEALSILKQLLEQPLDEREIATQIGQYLNYSARLELIHLLFEIAYSDGEIHQKEISTIHRISLAFRLDAQDYESIKAPYNKQNASWAYTTLEVECNATDDEVKKAYRRMAMKYHPDKVAAMGEDIKRTATDKFRTINEAYEQIKRERGFN